MRLPAFIIRRLRIWAHRTIRKRKPDFVIRPADHDYLRRWWVIPRNPFFNIYLHEILVSDDDRALHDHPWINASILLQGEYIEHTIDAGGIHCRRRRKAGDVVLRSPWAAQRLVVPGIEADLCLALFITGPRLRDWGFHCPDAGWRHWRDFTGEDKGSIGRGCGE